MRPIEFRAWEKGRKVMHFDTIAGITDDEYKQVFVSKIGYLKDGILMQFTGLLDKNGTKIFESDIVRWGKGEWRDACGGRMDELKISKVAWGNYGWKPFEDYEGYGGIEMFHPESCEVIGNIHENPELSK